MDAMGLYTIYYVETKISEQYEHVPLFSLEK